MLKLIKVLMPSPSRSALAVTPAQEAVRQLVNDHPTRIELMELQAAIADANDDSTRCKLALDCLAKWIDVIESENANPIGNDARLAEAMKLIELAKARQEFKEAHHAVQES